MRQLLVVGMLAATVLGGCAVGPAGQQTTAGTPAARTAQRQAQQPTGRSVVQPSGHPTPQLRAAQSHAPATRRRVNHCAHNHAAQLVLVSLSAQRAWLCARTRTVLGTAVTTGRDGEYTRTPTGRYHIQGRNRDSVLTLDTGAQYDVRYWIPFDAPDYGFHDARWQHFRFGSPAYHARGSHGCVHVPMHAIAFLYRWVHIGAVVVIRA